MPFLPKSLRSVAKSRSVAPKPAVSAAITAEHNADIPINALGLDILGQIFVVLRAESDVWIGRPGDLSCMHVSHVCALWRVAALGTPELWSQVSFCNPSWIDICVQRAKTVPLTIRAIVVEDNHLLLSRLLSYADNIISLKLHIHSHGQDEQKLKDWITGPLSVAFPHDVVHWYGRFTVWWQFLTITGSMAGHLSALFAKSRGVIVRHQQLGQRGHAVHQSLHTLRIRDADALYRFLRNLKLFAERAPAIVLEVHDISTIRRSAHLLTMTASPEDGSAPAWSLELFNRYPSQDRNTGMLAITLLPEIFESEPLCAACTLTLRNYTFHREESWVPILRHLTHLHTLVLDHAPIAEVFWALQEKPTPRKATISEESFRREPRAPVCRKLERVVLLGIDCSVGRWLDILHEPPARHWLIEWDGMGVCGDKSGEGDVKALREMVLQHILSTDLEVPTDLEKNGLVMIFFLFPNAALSKPGLDWVVSHSKTPATSRPSRGKSVFPFPGACNVRLVMEIVSTPHAADGR
ncbi:hypothetical protein C8R44DRAFT_853181 [Mycena epipterygia]|nr:hypothetical protein C8R44DRAFT_853181 [Mycena epipterygia]